MLASIKSFFEQRLGGSASHADDSDEHRARLAAAALLVEVVRSDEHITVQERVALQSSIGRKFDLQAGEAQQLLALAEEEAHEATDLYQFTSQINRAFSAQQKVRLIEELWRVANADEVLHHHEEHLIRKVADLIHVPHASYINAKLRALQPGDRAT